jgi:hypothetical protein
MNIKLHDREADELKELLTLAIHAVIAEFSTKKIDRFEPGARLAADLGLSPVETRRLRKEVAFIFDIPEADISCTSTVGDVVDQVAKFELGRLVPDLSMRVA